MVGAANYAYEQVGIKNTFKNSPAIRVGDDNPLENIKLSKYNQDREPGRPQVFYKQIYEGEPPDIKASGYVQIVIRMNNAPVREVSSGGKTRKMMDRNKGSVITLTTKMNTDKWLPDLDYPNCIVNLYTEKEFDELQQKPIPNNANKYDFDTLESLTAKGQITSDEYFEQFKKIYNEDLRGYLQERDEVLLERQASDIKYADLNTRYVELESRLSGEYAHVLHEHEKKLNEVAGLSYEKKMLIEEQKEAARKLEEERQKKRRDLLSSEEFRIIVKLMYQSLEDSGLNVEVLKAGLREVYEVSEQELKQLLDIAVLLKQGEIN